MGEMPQGIATRGEVTVVLTSCGRHDLLNKTIESFVEYNTYPIKKFIVFEDGAEFDTNIKSRWPHIQYIGVKPRIGQIRAIDEAYRHVQTQYIFHLEDDWEFYRHGFIEASMEILQEEKKIICVWLREQDDTNKHPLVDIGKEYKLLSTDYHWKGFTFNPGLRRLSDYKRLECYANHTHWNPKKPWFSEQALGYIYNRLGFKAAILKHGYVRHTGTGRHVI